MAEDDKKKARVAVETASKIEETTGLKEVKEVGEEKQALVEIKNITIDSHIPVCRKGKPVSQLIWEPGVDLDDGPGSKRPGVFEIGNLQIGFLRYKGLKVEVKVTDPNSFETATLIGELGGVKFTGEVDGRVTNQTVKVFPEVMPSNFKRIWGDMEWRLKYYDGREDPCVKPKKTHLEIFWIYGYPGKMYKKGVWVEVLRLLDVECFGLEKEKMVIRRIVNYCHSGAGLRYDVYDGVSHYGLTLTGGAFNLKAYLNKAHLFCNCYDQAGALQSLLGALGIEVTWESIEPFGFLHRTELVGRGQVNNPFLFDENYKPLAEILPTNDEERWGFANHAFCVLNEGDFGVILDACAGPHLGDDNRQQYLENSVDGLTNLYPRNYLPYPGRLKDIDIDCPGVTDVHNLPSLPSVKGAEISDHEKKRREEFKRRVGFDEAGKDTLLTGTGVIFDWAELPIWSELKDRCGVTELGDIYDYRKFEQTRYGIDTTAKEWCLIGVNEYISIEIYVSIDSQTAKDRLFMLATSNTLPRIPFKKDLFKLGHLDVSWYSSYYKIVQWWFHNVCIRVVVYNPWIELEDMKHLTRWLQEKLEKQTDPKKPLRDYLPVIKEVHVSPSWKVGIDEEVTIRVVPEGKNPDSYLLTFFFAGEYLRLVEEDLLSLTFKSRTPGFTGICLVLVNKQNLLCSLPKWVGIEVVI